MPRKKQNRLHINQRIEDSFGNKGRVLNPELREGFVRVKLDVHTVRDYTVDAIKPISLQQSK